MRDRGLPRSRPGAGRRLALGLAFLLACALAPGDALPADAPRRPERILLVSVDGLGAERADAAGGPGLAAWLPSGAHRVDARSPARLTFPALTALLSGRDPAATGVVAEDAAGFPAAGAALAPALAGLGYRGLALPADAFAHAGTGIGRGFERYVADAPSLPDSARVDSALAWLARPGRRFVWLALSLGEAEAAWRREDGPAFATAGDRDARAAELDRALARLAAGLERARLAAGTLVAVVGTHGLPGDADPLRVPLAVSGPGAPGGVPAGGEAWLTDVAPTLVRAAGGKPAGFGGRDLAGASAAPRPAPAGIAAADPAAAPCRAELAAALGAEEAAPDSTALARLHALAERCPDDPRLAIEEAVARSRVGQEAEAARRFAALRERWPRDAAGALAYAQHLIRHQRHEMVAGALAAIPRESPPAAEAAWLEVAALAGALRFSEAAAAARRAAALTVPRAAFGGAPASLERLRAAHATAEAQPEDFAAQLAFGRQLGEFGLVDEAYRRLHRARAADSTSAEPDYWIATFLMRQGRLKPAVQTLERALATDPSYRPARIALAEALVRLDRAPEAIPHLERALAADPADARSAYNLACLLAREGRPAEALRALSAALDAGYAGWDRLATDPDLDPLRELPEFRALLARRPAAR